VLHSRGSAPATSPAIATGRCKAAEVQAPGLCVGSAPALLMVGGRLKGDTSPPVWTLAALRSALQWWTGP
jgi:hypothetical protein